ncbi:hypothetical protein C1645_795377 [Glomus cerebriforme]|uniref:Uncharacterized protein n=1 Tax=Glomus cerebriforme TaxID=658196 RepID=A0A397RYM2_9GLOM|nr:hypothetical protein C1645_795377 [Glomus cerebriforme]
MIRIKNSTRKFPLTKLPYDIIENVIKISITNTSTTLTGTQLMFVNRLFAKISIPYIWKHLYLIEPEERKIFNTLSTLSENLMFDYKSFVKRITICPISMSFMSSGGLLKTLEIVKQLFSTQPLIGISIEDKLDFCHICHVGEEITFNQVSKDLLTWKGLKEFQLDSSHSSFNDDLLGELLPNFAPSIDKVKGIHGGLEKISLSGSNFTDQGILQHVIPHVKDTLIEFNAGYEGMNSTENITGFSILELLKYCKKLERVSLEGVDLHDSDFIKPLIDDEDDDIYCDELLDDNLSDFDVDCDSSVNNSIIIPHPTQNTFMHNISTEIKHLYLGKINQSTFTHTGLLSFLSLCHKSLLTLTIDLDHITETVLLDVFIPLFSCTQLQEIHLISESWSEWALHYPRPRSEFEVQAKEAMWRWKLKNYGLSEELIQQVGEKIESLRVFSIIDKNYLAKS